MTGLMIAAPRSGSGKTTVTLGLLRALKRRGVALAPGSYHWRMASINAVHAHMNRQLVTLGGRIDAVFFCPHTPEEHCDCRKPKPGLLRDIGLRYGADLSEVPMVGDTLRDLQAAAAAGCPPHLVLTGRAADLDEQALAHLVEQVPSTRVHRDLPAFAEWLLRKDNVPDSGAGALAA